MLTISNNDPYLLENNMDKVESFLKKSKEQYNIQVTNGNRLILLLIDNLSKVVSYYNKSKFNNLAITELYFSKQSGVSRIIQNEVLDFLNQGNDAITDPTSLLESLSIVFFADLYEYELSNLNEKLPNEITTFNANTLLDSKEFSIEKYHELVRISTIIPVIALRKYATSENMQLIQNIKNDSKSIENSVVLQKVC